ncbi:hypothetical protein BD309DRAFT_529111 [Dichomitus squalens]|nr:hypothetical protein BD309DRAFT_529111 [Dichomitus squalens]
MQYGVPLFANYLDTSYRRADLRPHRRTPVADDLKASIEKLVKCMTAHPEERTSARFPHSPICPVRRALGLRNTRLGCGLVSGSGVCVWLAPGRQTTPSLNFHCQCSRMTDSHLVETAEHEAR